MKIRELGHIVLYVHDLELSAKFYRDILGWNQLSPTPDELPSGQRFAIFNSGSQRTHHELLLIEAGTDARPIPPNPRVGMYHFGLKIGDSDDDLREALTHLTSVGVTIVGATDHHLIHSLYINDPDGNEVELYIDVPGIDWRENPSRVAAPAKRLRL